MSNPDVEVDIPVKLHGKRGETFVMVPIEQWDKIKALEQELEQAKLAFISNETFLALKQENIKLKEKLRQEEDKGLRALTFINREKEALEAEVKRLTDLNSGLSELTQGLDYCAEEAEKKAMTLNHVCEVITLDAMAQRNRALKAEAEVERLEGILDGCHVIWRPDDVARFNEIDSRPVTDEERQEARRCLNLYLMMKPKTDAESRLAKAQAWLQKALDELEDNSYLVMMLSDFSPLKEALGGESRTVLSGKAMIDDYKKSLGDES